MVISSKSYFSAKYEFISQTQNSCHAVSYTHLLKMLKTLKKITTLTLKAKTLLTKKMILMIMKKVKAVSYTHLDVYKRQRLTCMRH